MLTAVLLLSMANVCLQLLAAYQRHEGLKHQRRNGCGCRKHRSDRFGYPEGADGGGVEFFDAVGGKRLPPARWLERVREDARKKEGGWFWTST